LRNAILLRLFL